MKLKYAVTGTGAWGDFYGRGHLWQSREKNQLSRLRHEKNSRAGAAISIYTKLLPEINQIIHDSNL